MLKKLNICFHDFLFNLLNYHFILILLEFYIKINEIISIKKYNFAYFSYTINKIKSLFIEK